MSITHIITRSILYLVCKKGIVDDDVVTACSLPKYARIEAVVNLVLFAICGAVACMATVAIVKLYRRAYANEMQAAKPAGCTDIAQADHGVLRKRSSVHPPTYNGGVNNGVNNGTIYAAESISFASSQPHMTNQRHAAVRRTLDGAEL